ncbi:MAG: hypothetical protein MI922_02395, partial [Bacteroidales bacterium]|nr:hypothetical protein [Bacteroidales bacterium]
MKRRDVFNHELHYRTKTMMLISMIFLLSFYNPMKGYGQKKVKIFLMAGQSNMEGHGDDRLRKVLCAKEEFDLPDDPNGCYQNLPNEEDRVFETITDFYGGHSTYDANNARVVAKAVSENPLVDGRLMVPFDQVQVIHFNYRRTNGPRFSDGTWSGPLTVGYGHDNDGESYGPELVMGHYLSQHIAEDIVFVKVAEGGTDLYENWRSPSMEARLGVSSVESNYPLLTQHLNEVLADIGSFIPKYQGVDVELEVAGFLWHQGWNDGIGGNASTYAPAYEQNLTDLIADLRNELNMPNLPVVIAQSQNDGYYGRIVQEAQESVANKIGNAKSFVTTDLSNYFHHDPAAYLVIGNRMAEKMTELLHNGNPGVVPAKPTANGGGVCSDDITINWIDNSDNETGFKVERAVNSESNFIEYATLSANTRSFTDPDLPKSTYRYRVCAFNGNGSSGNCEPIVVTLDKLVPLPWICEDIGNPSLAGSADCTNGIFAVEGNGTRITSNSDQFHFVYQPVSGDGE